VVEYDDCLQEARIYVAQRPALVERHRDDVEYLSWLVRRHLAALALREVRRLGRELPTEPAVLAGLADRRQQEAADLRQFARSVAEQWQSDPGPKGAAARAYLLGIGETPVSLLRTATDSDTSRTAAA
jgi:hypothetical protein